jgi:hypothetical protein
MPHETICPKCEEGVLLTTASYTPACWGEPADCEAETEPCDHCGWEPGAAAEYDAIQGPAIRAAASGTSLRDYRRWATQQRYDVPRRQG